jgi:hypothetical protein
VYNTDLVPATFELTDPAIHYKSNKGRRLAYGRTDKGQNAVFQDTRVLRYLQVDESQQTKQGVAQGMAGSSSPKVPAI